MTRVLSIIDDVEEYQTNHPIALDTAEKKIGEVTGHPVDPNKYRDKNEKVTDKVSICCVSKLQLDMEGIHDEMANRLC